MRNIGVYALVRVDAGRASEGVDNKELDIKLVLWFEPSHAVKTTIQM